jgi:hypothetical protein
MAADSAGPGDLVACYLGIPAFAQLEANREGTLFGPGPILFRENLHILRGNRGLLEPRSDRFAAKPRGGRGNIMETCRRASLRLKESGDLSLQTVLACAHFAGVNDGSGLTCRELIVGSARRAKRCHRNQRQGTRDSFPRLE